MFVITCSVQVTTKGVCFNKYSVKQDIIRGLTEENTLLGIISTIGYFKIPIGDILPNWRLRICSLKLLY